MNHYGNIEDEIAKVAYDLWEKGGRKPGKDLENWLEAERIVKARYSEMDRPKEKTKKSTTFEKIPVELKKTSIKEGKKETPTKKGAATKVSKKGEVKREERKTR